DAISKLFTEAQLVGLLPSFEKPIFSEV
ncbi:MAG: hypothetical protein RLY43_1182, partial [Bacteroidota bacterium]